MRRHLLPVLALAVAACAAPGPRAEVDDRLYDRQDPRRHGAKVMAVDGDTMIVSPIRLEPGRRTLAVVSLGAARGGVQHPRPLVLEAEACVRYYVAAQHACPSCEDWEPVVYAREPIGDCDAAAPAP